MVKKERGNRLLRSLDWYVGIPLLFILSTLKRKKIKDGNNRNIKRVLVIKLGAIGDTVLLMPVLKTIKESFPGMVLSVVGSNDNIEVLNRVDWIDDIILFDISRTVKDPLYLLDFIRKLSQYKFQLTMDFEPWSRISALLATLIRSEYKVGFRSRWQYRHYNFDIAVPHQKNLHERDNYEKYIEQIGLQGNNHKFIFPINELEEKKSEEILQEFQISHRLFVVFHPWNAGYKKWYKEWNTENYIKLAERLISREYSIVVTGSPQDSVRVKPIIEKYPGKIFSVCGRLNLGESIALIKKSLLLVTANTGIMHIVATFDHPMIAIHGPVSVQRWGPLETTNCYNFDVHCYCSSLYNHGFEFKCRNKRCIDEISPDQVAETVFRMLENGNPKT